MSSIPDFLTPPPPLRLHTTVSPLQMTFLHPGQTQLQLVTSLYTCLYAPQTRGTRVWLVFSEMEVIATFLVCAYMLHRKRSLGSLWVIRKRDSRYGKFLVANAVFVLVLGVATYLGTWATTALAITTAAFAKTSALDWWWIIPAPWWPLVTGAYVSIHGFALGCSPRSPLSSLVSKGEAGEGGRKRWFYLPVPKSSLLVNLTLIVPCVLFTISTILLTTLSGRAHYHARSLRAQLLPRDVDQLINHLAQHGSVMFETQDQPAPDELVWAARRVAAAFFNAHRYVCLNLIVYASAAMALFVPCIIYGLPNLVSLVDHPCARYPHLIPPACNNVCAKIHFLLTKARPKTHDSHTQMNISTWKMTMLAITFVLILVTYVPAYASLPILIVGLSWPHQVERGDIGETIKIAIILVSIITILSCTFVALFCTIATLDPLFRAAIGLNMIRTHIPIDITVVQHKSEHEGDDERFSTEATRGTKREIKIKTSESTLRTTLTQTADNANLDWHSEIELDKKHSAVTFA